MRVALNQIALGAGLVVALLAGPAARAALPCMPAPIDAPPHELRFDGKTPNAFSVMGDAIKVESRSSVSGLFFDAPAAMRAAAAAHWRWSADGAPLITDLQRKGGDDRFLAVYFGFAFDRENASPMERLRHDMMSSAAGRTVPGRTLAYVWGGPPDGPKRFQSPYEGDVNAVVVLRSGAESQGEFEESAALAEDYRRAFGAAPTALISFGVIADSDDTGSAFSAAVRALCWSVAGAAPAER